MKLWLLRHGEAERFAATDAKRQLTDAGCLDVNASAQALRGVALTHILVSPYVRAQQTATLVTRAIGWQAPLETVNWLTPDTPVQQTLTALNAYTGEVLLIAHQPLLGDLAGLLQHGHRQAPEAVHTAQLLCLEGPDWLAGLMTRCY